MCWVGLITTRVEEREVGCRQGCADEEARFGRVRGQGGFEMREKLGNTVCAEVLCTAFRLVFLILV
jgi:hypothetical protein